MTQRTGKIRTVNLRPEQDEALNALMEETGLSRNRIVREIATKMTASEILALMDRPPVDRPG